MHEGASFGPYRVLRKLGAGGMGEVFLAEHGLIGRRAAIKVLQQDRTANRENVDRFFNEARATSAVSDPGIVQVYDFGITVHGTAYIVMEYLEGEPLNQRLRRRASLTIADALRITRQVAGSLAEAHAAGIIHRDLKPANLFMVRDAEALGGERPKILDFGIAKLEGEAPDRFKTRTGAVMGTPVYMSPEQCNDSGKIDHRTDIYSLGCVLFHLLTGRPPFDLAGIGEIISAHLREPPPAPSTVAAHVPAIVDRLVLRCLAKAPKDRFSNMLELQHACDAILAQLSALPSVDAVISTTTLSKPLVDEPTTTLATSVGQSAQGLPRSRLGLRVGIAAVAVAAGLGTVFVVARTGTGSVELAAPPGSPIVDPVRAAAEPPPDAAPVDAASALVDGPRSGTPKLGPKRPSVPPRTTTEELYDDRN